MIDDDKFIKFIDKLDERFDKIDNKLDSQGETLVRLTVSVEEHSKRSDTLEKMYDHLDTKIQPLKDHVSMMQGITKFLGFLIPFVGVALGIIKFLAKH